VPQNASHRVAIVRRPHTPAGASMPDSPRSLAFVLLLMAIGLSTSGELFLKKGVSVAGSVEFSVVGMTRIFTTWQILLGFTLFAAGALLWLKVLSLADLSWAYPMLAMGYPLIVLGSVVFLGEPLNLQRVLGSLLILGGVFVTFHSWGR
jgi:multidrug transporter EmrE-like cation transporter